MSYFTKKALGMGLLVTVLISTSPVSAAWSKPKSAPAKQPAPVIVQTPAKSVVTPVVVPTQNVVVPVQQAPVQEVTPKVSTVTQPNQMMLTSTAELTWTEILMILSQNLTPEQLQKLIEVASGVPYILSEEQLAQVLKVAKQISSEAPYVLPEEVYNAMVVALKEAALNWDASGEYSEQVALLISQLQKLAETKNLENNENTRLVAKALLLSADQVLMTYSDQLMGKALPASELSLSDQAMITTKLADIYQTYKASWHKINALDVSDPASATVILSETALLYYNDLHTSYFETIARPVLSATQTILVEKELRYALTNLQTASEMLKQKVDLTEKEVGYADTAMAQMASVIHLVGRHDVNGVTLKRIDDAVTLAWKVLNEKTNDRPAILAGYAINNMITATKIMQDVTYASVSRK